MKKNINIIYIAIITLLCFERVNAQQEHQYTQFMYNKLVFNPAFAGAREVSSVSALYRRQWLGFDGAPTSALIGFDAPFLKNRLGFGLNIHRFAVGINDNYAANMSYSYSIVRTDDLNIKFGIGGTFRYYKFDFSNIYANQANDPATLSVNDQTNINGNIGAGLYFTYKEMYLGISAPSLYHNKLGNGSANVTAEVSPHYYAMAGAVLPLSENVDFKPAVMFKLAKNAPFSGDVNATLMFNKKFNIGGSYRFGQSGMGDSFDGLLFMQASPKFGLGIAYDYNISRLSNYNKGSIEALMRYDITAPKLKKNNLTNPRFFF